MTEEEKDARWTAMYGFSVLALATLCTAWVVEQYLLGGA